MIKAWILSSEVDELRARFERIPDKVMQGLKPVLKELAKSLASSAKALAPRDKGSLRGSIYSKVTQYPDAIIARVVAGKKSAHLMEYGFSGTEQVKAHMRKVGEVFGHQMKSPREIMIKAHCRQVNYPERSYLRWAMREMEPQIKRDMGDAVMKAATEES